MTEMFNYQRFLLSLTDFERRFAPKELFVSGDTSLLSNGLKICVVGSRKLTMNGRQDATCITQTLVNYGVTVVSGLAEGIDTVAHETAMNSGGRTIAVIGTPLNVVYPAKNRKLQDVIMRDHLVVSQFPEGYPTTPGNFPIRNRTMALLSDATIIVEATETSGTRHQGWEALRLGRMVFIMKSVVQNPELAWPKEMMRYGAQELTCEDLPEFLDGIPNVTARLAYA